ncbi:MAG: pyridoxamine 5'-phosphate oxidase, partial [Hyphomicrobiales bacterium]|nr:pyridoxamine 5'-phosphate oxidase [Hyphomicrobiales bacterium]
ADPRAALLVAPPSPRGDPLDAARLTVSGRVVRDAAEATRIRHLARNPKARLYAGFGDFAFFRLEPAGVHFNGGFGRAAPLALADVTGPAAPALAAGEADILAELAADPSRLAALADAPGVKGWKAIGVDAFGLDLLRGRQPARVGFAAPATTPEAWAAALAAIPA